MVEHGQRVAIRVAKRHGGHTDAQVDLLGVGLVDREHRGHGGRRDTSRLGAARRQSLPRRHDLAVIDIASARQHDVGAAVVAGEEVGDVVAGHRLDRLLRAEHVTTELVARECGVEHEIVDPVRGLVVTLEDLLHDHAPLDFDIVGGDQRCAHDVDEDRQRLGPVLIEAAARGSRCARVR